jgi:hypothetical protein
MDDGSWFVYRSPYEGPSPVLVRRLPDPTPLAWFGRVWAATADADTGRIGDDVQALRWVDQHLAAELGADVYGLAFAFLAASRSDPAPAWDRDGPLPAATWPELRNLLRRYLYVEGDPAEGIQVDEHSVRAKTGDDEAYLSYFFLDDALVRAAPDRVAYLMLGDWRLPAATEPGRFGFEAPFPMRTLVTHRPGAGTTWLVVFDSDWEEFGETPPVAFAGVRLPELPVLLRTAVPAYTEPHRRFRDRWSSWPWEPLALRALVAPGDRSIGAALRRYNRLVWRLGEYESVMTLRRSAEEPQAAARARVARFLDERPPDRWHEQDWRDPALSRIQAGRHLVQAVIHVDRRFSYQRWYLFDDVWAAAHPDLAASLLRCGAGWDPLRD